MKYKFIKCVIGLLALFSNSAYSACDLNVADDGVLTFGNDPSVVEFTNLQEAINMARDCEFQVVSFATTQSNLAKTNGYEIVWNTDSVNTPWKGGVDEINSGDLIQFNNQGKWYEIKSVTENTILLTRKVGLPSGNYTYKVTKPIKVGAKRGKYVITSTVDFSGIHYLTLTNSGRGKPTFSFTRRPDFTNAPSYGHLKIDSFNIVNSAEAPLFLGNPNDSQTLDIEHDIDLTITNSLILNIGGVDLIKSNYHGNIVFSNSHFESKNDVVFLPYGNSFKNPRSILISQSMIVTSSTVTGRLDVGGNKALVIRTREDGNYTVKDSMVSVLKVPFGNAIVNGATNGIRVISNANSNVLIDNVNVVCNSCNGSVGSAPKAAIMFEGSGGNYTLANSRVMVDSLSCGVSASNGAIVNTINNIWVNDIPSYCYSSGGVIY